NGTNDILTITRQKNPNQFILSHNQKSYEDKVAQSIIDNMFGTYDIWLASCYIGQGCRNTFLTAPNNGKMELLNSIAFHEEDPNIYIDRIEDRISSVDVNYKAKLAHFTTNVNFLQTLLANIDVSLALSQDQILANNLQITKLLEDITALEMVKTQRDINLGILTNLQYQYDQ